MVLVEASAASCLRSTTYTMKLSQNFRSSRFERILRKDEKKHVNSGCCTFRNHRTNRHNSVGQKDFIGNFCVL